MESSVLQKYYIRYLYDIRNLSDSSVKHYLDALKNISRFLVSKGLIKNNIYEILDIDQLLNVRDILYSDPDFLAQDRRGHQMYSAGLNNYCRFAMGEQYSAAKDKAVLLDIPVEVEAPQSRQRTVWDRSGIIRNQCLELADFSCEINNEHESFISERTNHKYMEGHHAIPMRLQAQFPNSLPSNPTITLKTNDYP